MGQVNVRLHLRHDVDATSRMGLGGVGRGQVNVRLHLRHDVDATSRMGLGGVGWGMLRFACTCVMNPRTRLGEDPQVELTAVGPF